VSESSQTVSAGRTLGDYRTLLRRRGAYLATILPASVLLALFLAYVLPVSYRASGTIMLEPSSIPKEMVSTTVRGIEDVPAYAQQELELVHQRVMIPERLRELVKEIDPYPRERDLGVNSKAQLVAKNTTVARVDPITLQPLESSTAFSIYYDNPDPQIAAAVAAKIVGLYLTYNQRTRTEQAAAAYDFLHSQAKELEQSMVAMEQKLAQFKAAHSDALPDMQTRNLASRDRLEHDLEDFERQIIIAEEKESQLQLQLNNLSPSMTSAVSDWRLQLAKLRADLAVAQQKYTEAHPEVRRLKRAIAELAAQGNASIGPQGSPADNPEYLQVQSQLNSARRDIANLRANESRARSELSSYEHNLALTPNVEREYVQLVRDYENSRSRYEDLQTKMKNAALARTMENEARGERFSLLHAPTAPTAPYFPNRLGIILLGIVLGAGIAVATAAIVDASDPTVRGTSDLQAIMDAPPIGAVPQLLNASDRRQRKWRWATAVVAFSAAAILMALTVVIVDQ
jgi:succinoglycan biosynthesis transport protein ExoP